MVTILRSKLALVLAPLPVVLASCAGTDASSSLQGTSGAPSPLELAIHGATHAPGASRAPGPWPHDVRLIPPPAAGISVRPGVTSLEVTVRGSARATTPTAVTLPRRLSDGFVVKDPGTGLSLDVKMPGAKPAQGRVLERGLVVYDEGLGAGRHVVHRPGAEGVEDYVVFDDRPAIEELRYDLAIPARAGLRLVAGVLELVDEGGAPRLRMVAPWVKDAAGRSTEPTVRVEGCAVDVSLAAPWGRAPIAPGRDRCQVVIGFAAETYPIVVDPAWTTTASLAGPRYLHGATRLSSGKVLVSGGYTSKAISTAELYDPATRTWAVTGSLATARQRHVAGELSGDRAIVAGGTGQGGALASSEVYELSTGLWKAGAPLAQARYNHTASVLSSGEVLVVGGRSGLNTDVALTEVYNPSQDLWASSAPLSNARDEHTASVLPNGHVLVVGGRTGAGAYLGTAESYDVAQKTWSAAGSLGAGLAGHTATVLGSGEVLVVGGFGDGGYSPSIALYDPGQGSWTPGVALATGRSAHTASLLPSGEVLVAGGASSTVTLGTSVLYAPTPGAWSPAPSLQVARHHHTVTGLPGGELLVVGGVNGSGDALSSVELWAQVAQGGACASSDDCASHHCVDGVCCETACADVCEACRASKTGQPDGTCAPVSAGTDPDDECTVLGAGVCRTTGFCDGKGSCGDNAGQACSAPACVSSTTLAPGNVCDAVGTCSSSPAPIVDCAPFSCKGAACLTICQSMADCVPGSACVAGICTGVKGNGKACSGPDECKSGFCVDGVCCDSSCTGQCQACDVEGKEGSCASVGKGDSPHGGKPACAGSGACQGVCDGIKGSACVYPGVATLCGSTCQGASLVFSRCGGEGSCVPQQGESCAPFACDGQAGMCKTTCASATDCDGAHGYVCLGGLCKVPSGTGGAGAGGSGLGGAGTGGSGAAGAATGGTSMGGSGAAPSGMGGSAVGSGAGGTGVGGSPSGSGPPAAAPSGTDEESGGCGCSVPRAERAGWWALAVAGVALASRRRR